MPPLQAAAPALVLASGSATRAALLEAAGLAVTRLPPAVDETAALAALAAAGAPTEEAATTLAELKARSVAARAAPGSLLLGADQILELDGDWLERPADLEGARAQLLRLRGRPHRLVSAAVLVRDGTRLWHAVDRAELRVRPFSDAFLEAYLARAGRALTGSVGAYRLEGLGALLMERVRGDHFTILGLPLLPLLAVLREQGVLLD
jgi:septum formation protein